MYLMVKPLFLLYFASPCLFRAANQLALMKQTKLKLNVLTNEEQKNILVEKFEKNLSARPVW
jgi:hypothetical protein